MASSLHTEVLAANKAYAESFGAKSQLALPPARKAAFLVCMDARLDPAKFAGLHEGDAHVIRNAGGRASEDAIRSLVISHKLLATNEFFVVHHTDCGMEYFTDERIAELLATSLATADIVVEGGAVGFRNAAAEGGAPAAAKAMAWLSFKTLRASVEEDVSAIRGHALVNPAVPVHGYIYDVKTGLLQHVVTL